MEKLKGLSNHVFKVTDTEGGYWIFKILLSTPGDPFKKMERLAMALVAQMNNSTLFDDKSYRIETFIPNEDTTLEQVMRPEEGFKVMRAISAFNRLSVIEASEPNWVHIFRKDAVLISNRIEANLSGLPEPERAELRGMLEEVESINAQVSKRQSFDLLVLSHNDLFYRNLIYGTDRSRHVLIDFEYAGYNPFGMDVFQFINEFLIDYNIAEKPFFRLQLDQYPTPARCKELIRFFLFFHKNEALVADMPDSDEMIGFVRGTKEFAAIPEAEVRRIFDLFPYFGVITNIYWFYWGLYLFKVENIAFDYVAFAKAKFEMVKLFLKQMPDVEMNTL